MSTTDIKSGLMHNSQISWKCLKFDVMCFDLTILSVTSKLSRYAYENMICETWKTWGPFQYKDAIFSV